VITRRKVAQYIAHAWVDKTTPRRELIQQMAGYLVASKKTHETELLINDIKQEIAQAYGVVVADVFSATQLDEQLLKAINSFVLNKTGAKKVIMNNQIDEAVLAGVLIKTPETQFDLTARSKLAAMRRV
jgi:F-type H+-transporting ATPase subunit delta